jgi:ATP-dependent DNA helicase RecG
MVDKVASQNNARLKAILKAKNGFELAEADLAIRGAGELYGRRQWGLSDIGMEALKNIKLVEAARSEAFALVAKDHTLTRFPELKKQALHTLKDLHFE